MPINDTTGEINIGLRARMVDVLNKVAQSAREKASWSTKISNAITVGEVKEQNGLIFGYIEVGGTATNEHGQPVNVAHMARAFEYGSGIHARRKGHRGIGKYPITPHKIGGFLAFDLPETWEYSGYERYLPDGRAVFKEVMHPGVEARPFLHPAVQENREWIKQTLGTEFKQQVSKAIRFSWSKNR